MLRMFKEKAAPIIEKASPIVECIIKNPGKTALGLTSIALFNAYCFFSSTDSMAQYVNQDGFGCPSPQNSLLLFAVSGGLLAALGLQVFDPVDEEQAKTAPTRKM